jgi:signal transduction histidine kinase
VRVHQQRLVQKPRGLFVTGTAELLRRAVENVVRNAIRFTATGTEVEVTGVLMRAAG